MAVAIEKVKNRIHLRSSRPTPRIGETVPGANFNKGTVHTHGAYWSMPLSLLACQSLRARFGEELAVGPELWAWAKAEKARSSQLKALAGAADAELRLVPVRAPRLAKAMEDRTYQRVGARFIAEARNCLIGDQPGLGKTLEALGGIVEADCPGPYLVVTPKTAVETVWAREIPRWLGVPAGDVVTVPDGAAERNRILDELLSHARLRSPWVVVHPEMVRTRVFWVCGVCGQETRRKLGKVVLACEHDAARRRPNRVEHNFPQLFAIEWGAVIADESDRSLLRSSGNPTQTRQGMEDLKIRADGLRIAMSGTPFRGRPHLLWGTLNWLDAKKNPDFWPWCRSYWEVEAGKFGGAEIGQLIREEELWASLDSVLLRRTKAEVATDLPDKTYAGTPATPGDPDSPIGVWLPMGEVQGKAYREMLENSATTLEDGSELSAIGILAELTRLKQFAGASGRSEAKSGMRTCKLSLCAEGVMPHKHMEQWVEFHPALPSNKFEYLVQLLDELGYPDDPQTKVVIASQFTEVLELLAAELPARLKALSAHPRTNLPNRVLPRMLTGKVTGKARERVIDEMNEEVGIGAHILFLNTKAGGVAITLDTADVMVVLDETWIPDDQEQLEDRIHRVSRPRKVTYHYLRSVDTVDLGIALVNAQREYATKRVLDERRGTTWSRSVLQKTKELGK